MTGSGASGWAGQEEARAASGPLTRGVRSPAELEDRLVHFINQVLPRVHGPLRESPGVDRDTPLFENRVIDSLAILHLVLFLEEAIGRRLSRGEVVMRHFRTVGAMVEAFWAGE